MIHLSFRTSHPIRNASHPRCPDLHGLSHCNEYIPLFSPFFVDLVHKKEDKTILQYTLGQALPEVHKPTTSYRKLYEFLSFSRYPMSFKSRSIDTNLIAMKGILYETTPKESIIHFMIAVKTDYIMSQTPPLNGIIDTKQLKVFLSYEFAYSDRFKTIRRKFDKEIMPDLVRKGIEIVITPSIEMKCFKNDVVSPTFSNLDEMDEYLESHNNKIYEH